MTWNLPWNGASPFADQTSRMQNWKEVKMSGVPLFTLVIFYFHEGRQHNIDVCVEFCFILELIYSSDFHEGRQYFMLMLALNFAF